MLVPLVLHFKGGFHYALAGGLLVNELSCHPVILSSVLLRLVPIRGTEFNGARAFNY